MTIPNRIWATGIGQDPTAHWWHDKPLTAGTTFLHEDGPTVTAWKEALLTLGADPDSIAREAVA